MLPLALVSRNLVTTGATCSIIPSRNVRTVIIPFKIAGIGTIFNTNKKDTIEIEKQKNANEKFTWRVNIDKKDCYSYLIP